MDTSHLHPLRSLPLLALLAFALSSGARADDIAEDAMPSYGLDLSTFRSIASRLRTSAADPETVWIGHIADPNFVPRGANGAPLPVPPGGWGPYHIGRGDNRPGIGPGANWNGVWDFDHYQPGEVDSLMGWWPAARPYQTPSNMTDDRRRGHYGFDYGNQGNYVINQGSPKRTFGVVGYWHRDRGNQVSAFDDTGTVVPGPNVEWAPLSGEASAWCGLRAHGDLSHVDDQSLGGTGNPYNQSVLDLNGNNSFNPAGSLSPKGTDRNYPGYGSQWDQLLYRDILLEPGADLSISFKYTHALSRVRGGGTTTRTGYYWKDPLLRTAFGPDGNYISATQAEASGGGPVDSFTVYLGVPVEPNPTGPDYVASDGSVREIGDLQRRWYSEVIRTNGPMIRVLSASGLSSNPTSGPAQPLGLQVTIPNDGPLASIISQGQGRVRIVFRVKTNRGSDDEDYAISGFTSHTRGAAIVDDVMINGWGASEGDFESPASIDNDPSVPATSAWKSTGKPPAIFPHVHTIDPASVQALPWNDPCSPPTLDAPASANRVCNMLGNVLTCTSHDDSERDNGQLAANDEARARIVASPSLPLVTPDDPSQYNPIGLNREVVANAADYGLQFDMHTPGFRGSVNGSFYTVAVQSYPAVQKNGATAWGEVVYGTTIFFSSVQSCVTTLQLLKSRGLVVTSNPSGIPDSIRVYFQYRAFCEQFDDGPPHCGYAYPSLLTGGYVDNLSFALVPNVTTPGLTAAPALWFADAFPATASAAFTSAAFDTSAALVKSAINRATMSNLPRPDVPGDSAVVSSGLISGLRVDLVFRVLPGVGNYVQIGNRSSGLRKVPTATTRAVASAGSRNFWESYMADNGPYGTKPSRHTSLTWDPNTWNSARMDTVEQNLFPCLNLGGNLGGLDASQWMTTYHELDPRYATLGIAKNRCFVVDPSVGRSASCASKTTTSVASCNLICGAHPVSPQFPPMWTQDFTSGLAPSENGLPLGRTYEFTKIIPDGQLTPGAHVQYFYRREPGLAQAIDLLPDTNQVFSGGQSDGQRWYSFSVLPDRWKDPAFAAGGAGMACMLVVDYHDRSGDEFLWVSAADSIGLTSAAKRGAHNGWMAAGGTNTPGTFDQATFRADNGGQPGSTWDLWNTRGSETIDGAGWLSSRLAAAPQAGSLLEGKQSRLGPTPAMLRQFYRSLFIMTGNLSFNFVAISGRTDDDIALLTDFAMTDGGTAKPRAVSAVGFGYARGIIQPPAFNAAFLRDFFGVEYRGEYKSLTGNPASTGTYVPVPGSAFDVAGSALGLQGQTFGFLNPCYVSGATFIRTSPTVPTAREQLALQNFGSAGPFIGAIYTPSGGAHPHVSFIDAVGLRNIGSYSTRPPLGRNGFRAYLFKALTTAFGDIGCGPQGVPVGVGDTGSEPGSAFVNFLGLGSANPSRHGEAHITFSLARPERIKLCVYDVSGRRVRVVVDRSFTAGQSHTVLWDGRDQDGQSVRSGVYFYRIETPTWTGEKKLTLLAR